jgi:hypothetical protein
MPMASRDKQPDAARSGKSSGKSSASLSDTDWKEIASDANRLRSIPENADFRYRSDDGEAGAEQGRKGDDSNGAAETAMNDDMASRAAEGRGDRTRRR